MPDDVTPEEQADLEAYMAAAHAMQTGVRIDQERGSRDGTPKHLRTGINSAMSSHEGLVDLLIEKGIFTRAEYMRAMRIAMEKEVARYEDILGLPHGTLA